MKFSTDTEEFFSLLDLVQPCEPYCNEYTYHALYSGTINTGTQEVDVTFSFHVDDNDVCHFCLDSEDLGIEQDCIEVDECVRSRLCRTCGRCCSDEGYDLSPPIPYDCPPLEWDVPISYAAPEGGTIEASRADNVPIPACDRCNSVCCGCDCICGKACITILHCGSEHTNELVTLNVCDWTYETSTGLVLTLVKGAYDEGCRIEVTELPPDITADEHPEPQDIVGLCPDFNLSWIFNDPSCYEGEFISDDVIIEFKCASCALCPEEEFECCPCGVLDDAILIPNSMFFSIRSGGCVEPGVDCRMDVAGTEESAGGETICIRWAEAGDLEVECTTAPSEPHLSINFSGVTFYCVQDKPLSESFVMEAGTSNMGCNLKTNAGDPPTLFGGTAAKYPDSFACLNDRYLATFTFELEDTMPKGCNLCPTNEIVIDVELIGA